ncbi:MAG: SusC/RagA family TonB-linked outer membrane protein, partial [Flavisolibacter sp.]|nr:SusC/RagA family TonB-linked outer membrane protein [Flavisolibacter sp.]
MKRTTVFKRQRFSISLYTKRGLFSKPIFSLLTLLLLSSLHLFAQKTVTGSVLDDKGQPLPRVSVTVKGSTTGTSTDANGKFTISAPGDATLVISSVGYTPQEIDLKGRSSLDVQMGAASQSLNEVVVTGYGQARKQDLTGSVAVVSGNTLRDQPVTNIDQKLTGQVAGVQVNQTTGIPGGGSNIQIRGQATFGLTTEPLFVVDGYPLPSSSGQGFSPLNAINPNDIESISILKDASSTAIYGSRGANGVVMITTKRGRRGAPVVNVNSYIGIQEVPQKGRPQLLNAREYAQFRREIYEDKGQTVPDVFKNPDQYGEGTNWFDVILQRAPQYNIGADVSGGTENSRYSFGLDYLNQEGTVRYTGFKRYGIRMNAEANLGKRIRVGLNLLPSYSKQTANTFETGFTDALSTALWLNPLVPVIDPATGQRTPLINTPGQLWPLVNPLNLLQYAPNTTKNVRGLGGTFVEVDIIKGLKARYNFNVDYNTLNFDRFIQRPAVGPIAINTRIASTTNRTTSFNYLSEALLTYDRSIGTDHRVNAVVGYSAQKQRDDFFGINAFYNDDQIQTINNAIEITTPPTADVQKWALISYLGRVNYTLKDKYLFTVTFRRDGSSRFGANQRYGNFPSGAIAWRASEEKFLQGIRWLSDLKLRASYGLGGNFNIGNYAYTSTYGRSDYAFGQGSTALTPGRAASTLNNPNLSWEESKQLDAGMDVGLFNNRISV